VGAASEPSDYVSFVDSDCLVAADYLANAVAVFAEVDAAMVGSMYDMPADVHWVEATWMRLNCPPREGYASLLPGGNMVLRRRAFDAVGGFSELFITGEDADLCERIAKDGGRIFETKRVSLVHLRNMNSISGFFKKQVWHSLGMLGARHEFRWDRVSVMSIVHLVFSIAALSWLTVGAGALYSRALEAALLILVVPLATVTYRVVVRGGSFIPMKSLLLYAVYFYARIWGLCRILFARVNEPKPAAVATSRGKRR
jgi:cellulose synthase/poly-beta-1,6-N-acetylglucosamine synthase-like glycosyltransferase